MILSLKQKKRKFKPRIKLNHNINTIWSFKSGLVERKVNKSLSGYKEQFKLLFDLMGGGVPNTGIQ